MNNKMKKIIALLFVFTWAWSCFGLSLGMIGHSIVNGNNHQEKEMHDCCETPIVEQETKTAGAMAHHDISIILTSLSLTLGAIIFIAVYTVLLHRAYQHTTHQYLTRYIREKWRRISHVACIYTRLFSRGILHPKTF